MERVENLINKLQEQLKQQADAKSMLVTVQMLNTELMQTLQQKNGNTTSKVSVMMPYNYSASVVEKPIISDFKKSAEKIEVVETPPILQNIEEQKVEEKTETTEPGSAAQVEEVEEPVSMQPEIKREHSQWIFDPIEAPTLAHQEKQGEPEKIVYELNESLISGESSLNDRLKIEKLEMAHILHDVPIRDLKKAISINDRHRFIQDLFRGDETMYERSIKTINNFENFAEAEFWMQRELKLKLAWDNNNPQVKLFDQLVRRRFA